MQQRKVDQRGIYIFPCGGTYVGSWYKDQESGLGTWTHPAGSQYAGDFKDGGFHGHGTLTWGDGFEYVGEFKTSNFDGWGTLTEPSGYKLIGMWSDGEFLEGIYLDSEGKTEFAYIDGSPRPPRENNVYALGNVQRRREKQ